MQHILEAIQADASGDEIAALEIPESYRAAFVQRDDQTMFEGRQSVEKDPRESIRVADVPTPELAPDEVYVAVMASSINFNTVWTSIFEPLPTIGILDRLGRESRWGARHALDHHVIGSDACGVTGTQVIGSRFIAITSTIRTRLPMKTRCLLLTNEYGVLRAISVVSLIFQSLKRIS